MILSDLHVHSRFCDGKDEPEALVLSAVEKGVKRLGILAHSYVPFDPTGTLTPNREAEFIQTVNALKEKYRGRIEILCGVEQDFLSGVAPKGYDYAIGSVHYFSVDNRYFPVDYSEEAFRQIAEEMFGGDYYAMAENYFASVAEVLEVTKADIVGHFDLITKYNEGNRLFDTENVRYVQAWRRAVDRLLPYGKPFEVNTGAVARGYRNQPYPALEIAEYILQKGGKLILSGDAHRKENIAFQFDKWKHIYCLED